jgi:outer membrane lipoprotein-sorting protein
MPNVRFLLAVALAFVVMGWLYALPAAAQSPATALNELEAKYRGIQTAVVTRKNVTTSSQADRDTTSTHWLDQRGDRPRFRIESVTRSTVVADNEPRETEQVIKVVYDGQTLWTEQNRGDQVVTMKRSATPPDPYDYLRSTVTQGEAELLEPETVAGEECVVIRCEVQRRGGLKETVTFYIGKSNGMVMKTVSQAEAGLKSVDEITSIKINEDLDESLFHYTPPPGARVVDIDDIKRRAQAPTTRPKPTIDSVGPSVVGPPSPLTRPSPADN